MRYIIPKRDSETRTVWIHGVSFEVTFEWWPPLPSLIGDVDVAERNRIAVWRHRDDASEFERRP